MSVQGAGEAEEGVEEGGQRGGGRGMTNPGRWLGCQWQVNIDVEEVFFFHILLLFFCDSGTAEPNTRRGGGRGGKGGSGREEGRHCRASSSAAGSTLRSNKPKGKCNKRENLVRDQPHQGCKGSGSSSSSEGSPGPSLAEIWLAIVGVGRGLS